MELKNVKNPWKARFVGKSIFSDGSVCTIGGMSQLITYACDVNSR